jgi:hypothetical protein
MKTKTKSKLPLRFGTEITGIIREYQECQRKPEPTQRTYDKTRSRATQISRALNPSFGVSPIYVHTDTHCVELESPVFTNFPAALKFYRKVWRVFRKHGLTPHNPQTVCGGGHLHFDVDTLDQIRNILRHVAHNPWLPWVFTQPDDTDSCNNVCSSSTLQSYGQGSWRNIDAQDDEHHLMFKILYQCPEQKFRWRELVDYYGNLKKIKDPTSRAFDYIMGLKSLAATPRCNFTDIIQSGWIEFRCVEAPKNAREFEDQLEFFWRFVQHFADKPAPPVKYIPLAKLQRYGKKRAIREFNSLLRRLGLDPQRYAKYVKRNLLPRWEYGRQRC